ncbi:MAG: major facilitator superfamily domain-containing protein 1 [bacterium]|nr:major facilitator superfamily domain-containing protein 1 [bacterium]
MTEKIKQTLKDSAGMRWLVMFLASGLTFGTYWFQDFYSGLKPLMETQMGITSSDFGALLGLTTIANVFGMIILGGIILDKWGIRITGIVFGSVATIGAALNAMGAAGVFSEDADSRLTVMIIGRVLFGTGLEVTCVVVMRTLVKWFKGYELALAMALNMGFGRLGSTIGTALSPDIAGDNVSAAVIFAATLIGLGLLLFIVYTIFDIKIDKQLADAEGEEEDEQFKFADLIKLVTNKSFIYISLLCVAFYSAVFPFMQYAPDLLVNKFGFSVNLPDAGQFSLFGNAALGNAMIFVCFFIFGIGFTLVPKYIKSKGGKMASIAITIALFLTFIYVLGDILGIWMENGPKVASLIPLGTILFTPVFGIIVDEKGKAASLMIIGSTLLIFAHLSLSIFDNVMLGYAGLLCLGVAFSLVPAAMWPSVAKIVPKNRLGTAYATMFTVQNWGLGLFFWGIGKVLDLANPKIVEQISALRERFETQGLSDAEIGTKLQELKAAGAKGLSIPDAIPVYDYTIPILMLVFLGVVSIFLAFMLKRADNEQGYGLEKPSNA